ncbi:MAG TPA: agmatinase [Bacillota bacterium]|nr:agmatinase [Bacillota bacterium]
MNDEQRKLWAGLNNPELGIEEAHVVVLGLPFDGATSFRKGAAQAPDRIRSITTHIPPTTEEGRLITALKLRDLGNLEPGLLSQEAYFDEVEAAAARLFGRTCPFFIGGDHSVTLPLLKAAAGVFREPLGIIHLDAHLDLCQELAGNRLSHGCTHRRALEIPFIELQNIHFVGIRSFEVQELEFIKGREANIYTAASLFERGLRQAAEEICRRLSPLRHVYITLDIDFLDPAAAPGTGTPKPGGFTTRELLELLRIFARLPVIGMDVVEVSPPLDHADITSFAAQRALTEMWGHLFGT